MDLADIIKSRPSKTYLSAALAMNWQWQSHERDEAAARTVKQRRLAREARAQLRGIDLPYSQATDGGAII